MTCPFCKFPYQKKRIVNLDGKTISMCPNCGGDVYIMYDFVFPIEKEEEEQ